MKANELMVGDLITFKDCQYDDEIVVVKIYQINQESNALVFIDNDKALDEVTIDEEFVGIPLTSEILEKNGYSYNETRDAWELIPNNGFGICKDEDDNCFYFCLGIFDAFNRYSDITYHYITKVEYTHELQHILKHCKIEKEITL